MRVINCREHLKREKECEEVWGLGAWWPQSVTSYTGAISGAGHRVPAVLQAVTASHPQLPYPEVPFIIASGLACPYLLSLQADLDETPGHSLNLWITLQDSHSAWDRPSFHNITFFHPSDTETQCWSRPFLKTFGRPTHLHSVLGTFEAWHLLFRSSSIISKDLTQ